MDCQDAHLHLIDLQRGRLSPDVAQAVAGHIAGCRECAGADAAERELTRVLEERLPQHPASLALKRRLREQVATAAPARERWGSRAELRRRWPPRALVPLAVAAALLVATPVIYTAVDSWRGSVASAALATQAVAEHLRVLRGEQPLGIVSSGIHEVKPWFAGKLDFAPAVAFAGDADFPLRGGAVEHVGDRAAALLVYGRRRHTISLLVFRPDGVGWSGRGWRALGPVRARVRAERGFNVIVWRAGDLGYALVSDLDLRELATLPPRITPSPEGLH